MCLRLNTSAGAMSASITVQRAALFAVVAMSKAHVTGRANTWSGATMINRRLLIYGAPKAAKEKSRFHFPQIILTGRNFPLVRYVTVGADILRNWRRRRSSGAVELDNR